MEGGDKKSRQKIIDMICNVMEKVEQDREKHGMEMNIITQEGARCRRKGNLFCPLCNQCVTV